MLYHIDRYQKQGYTQIWLQAITVLLVVLVAQSQDEEVISLSTTACDPSQDDCSCLDTQPPNMTLTCSLISENNLCEVPAVTDGDYCQRSCGTCVKCFTSNLGCECLSKWEYKEKMYSGCVNPDKDEIGSWCEIDQESCKSYKPKKYDYCAEDCTVQDLGNNTSQPTSRVSLTSEQDVASPPPPAENESAREGIQIGALTRTQIILVNQGSTMVNLTGWYLKTTYEELEFKGKGDGKCTKTVVEPNERVVIEIPSSEEVEDNLKNDCSLSNSLFRFNTLKLIDIYAQTVSEIDLGQSPLSNLNLLLSYCLQNGEYVLVSKLFCEYLS
eukprot:TRINITY_DN635_c0_g1_i6.p1 TRINITY_DN635_c0_g1~~TRINITY_DN635_c0_g1_i6.p1  ORF type:complete len:327 (+),score=24.58 TRINITY_DN635_c0_g1_i6:139-1119(+)